MIDLSKTPPSRHHRGHAACAAIACATALFSCLAAVVPAESPGLAGLRAARSEIARRQRRVIFNNDGCDCLYFPTNMALTAENFLALRTTPLAGSQVGAIAYCTISSGFSFFTHRTEAGVVLDRQGSKYAIQNGCRNIARDMIDAGTDCLQANIGFGRKHGMEVFWSMRMNDTHDAAYQPDKPYLLYPPLKVEHPDWLVGEPVKKTPVGRWSSVDYARPEIRDLAFRFIEEVCRNYDIDGVELDYFRHPCYFKSVAMGGAASAEECDMITALMRRVRTMTEEVGLKRGRPILVSVRVPDSVEYDRGLGLDVERWLSDGLVDLLITTCYFRLNPWSYSVELGHRHGVPVYPCLSDSRIKGETRFRRSSIEAYRGEAMNAWAAGAHGIHVFNLFNPKSPVFREVGDPAVLRPLEKLYFVTVRDGDPGRFLAGGARHQTLQILAPGHPAPITRRSPLRARIDIGEDLSWANQAGLEPQVRCHVEIPLLSNPGQVCATFNGIALADGQIGKKGWVDYRVPPEAVRRGDNLVEVAVNPDAKMADDKWTLIYDGDRLPAKPWTRDTGSPRTEETVAEGALRIADKGTQAGDFHYWRFPWAADPEGKTTVEARVKVVSGSSFILLSNGAADERLGFWPDHIDLWNNRKLRFDMNTTDDYHVYRIECGGRDLRVFVDGQLRIDATGKFAKHAAAARNELAFGTANSPGVGDAWWDYVKARSDGLSCNDLVASVSYKKK